MLNIEQFDDVFGAVGKNHYPTHLVSQVQAAQDQLGDKLFFHQLLDALHINGTSIFHGEYQTWNWETNFSSLSSVSSKERERV